MTGKPTWTCYLATPIDQAGSAGTWVAETRADLKRLLQEAGAAVYDPQTAWNSIPLPVMAEVNDLALRKSNALLAYLPDGVPSIGVPVEIERARLLNKPIAILGGDAVMNTPMWESIVPGAVVRVDADLVDLAAVVSELRARVLVPSGGTVESVPTSRPPVRKMRPAQLMLDHTGFLAAVRAEVERAEAKYPFGDQNSLAHWFSIWAEEVFEVIKVWTDFQNPEEFRRGLTTKDLETELVQVGAMSLRFWHSLVTGSEADDR